MPYNFQATFETPLLADFDQGRIASSRDLANAITKYYISTIKQGLPSGVPPSLPAPGLNPIAPPPFVIGASPYNTADSRRQIFFKVIYAYLTARDKIAKRNALQSLLRSINAVRLQIQQEERRIKNLAAQAKIITKEIAALPQLFRELSTGLNDIVATELLGLDELVAIVDQLKEQGSPAVVESLFAREIQIINTLRSFNVASIEGILALDQFISRGLTLADRAINIASSPQELARVYVENRLKGIVAIVLQIADVLTKPLTAMSFLRQLATRNPAAERLLALLDRIISIETIAKPQLVKINQEVEAARQEVQNRLRKKLANLQISQRELGGKPKSKKVDIFAKSAAEKNKERKKIKAKLKKVSQKVKLTKKLVGLVTVIVQRTAALEESLVEEFENLGRTIPKSNLSAEALQTQNKYLEKYFRDNGLPEFIPFGLGAMNQAACNIIAFREYFERPIRAYTNYLRSIREIEAAINELNNTIQELVTGKKAEKPIVKVSAAPGNVSLKSLLLYVAKTLAAQVKKSQKDVEGQQKDIEAEKNDILDRGEKSVSSLVESSTPTNSRLEDSKRKAIELKAKEEETKSKAAKIKKIITYSKYVTQVVRGSTGLTANLARGNYSSSNNLKHIDNIVEGVYGFKILEASPVNRQPLIQERNAFKKNFYKLVVVDNLFRVFLLLTQDVNNGAFRREWNQLFNNTQDFTEAQLAGINTLYNLLIAPPKNPKEFIDKLNLLSVDAITSVVITNRLLAIERKYLQKAKIAINTLTQVDGLDNAKLQRLSTCLNKQQSLILYLVEWISQEVREFNAFLKREVTDFIKTKQIEIESRNKRVKKQSQENLKTIAFKQTSGLQNILFSATLGLAARSFWTGASWVGPTGSTHTTISVGVFTPIKAKPIDGPSVFVKDISKGFQRQLKALTGFVTPPAPTLIPPIPFVGYK